MEKQQYRSYIKTRASLEDTPTEIHNGLVTVYGPQASSYSTVLRWSKRCEEEKMDVEDKPRSGRPVTQTTTENIEWVRSIIEADPHSTYDDIEAETLLSRGTIETIIHERLKMKKVTSRWVPHNLTPEQKQERVRICRANLEKFHSGSWRLYDIITGDETWIYFKQIGRKASNACWINEGKNPNTIVRQGQYAPKRLYSIFFKANGWLLVHALDKGQTIDRSYYIDNCLKPVVEELWKQRPKTGPKGLKLLHDNAKPHDNPDVLAYIKGERLQLMSHPPYSPDLAPCDFWLNDYIKRNLTDQEDEKALFKAVSKVVESIPEKEYRKTFDKLLQRMQRCIDNQGDYFEHLM
jgi:histone-lysine N-methyltransferase SETMAR